MVYQMDKVMRASDSSFKRPQGRITVYAYGTYLGNAPSPDNILLDKGSE